MGAPVITNFAPESTDSSAAIERYRCAYRAAEKAVAFGETIRLGGIVVGGVVLIGALVELLANPAEHSGFPMVFASFVGAAFFLVLVAQILGTGFQVQAQLLTATVDSNVHSSPFLSNAQRASAMSLRRQPPVPTRIRLRAA
jgi:hypothetical protein